MAMTPAEGFNPLGGRAAATDDEIFELLTAAVFQARFRSEVVAKHWLPIRRAFADFRLDVVARWSDEKAEELLAAPGVIRNPKKIRATIRNARELHDRSRRFGSAAAYLRGFRGDDDALVREIDNWAHYIGAPSIRWFVENLSGSAEG